MFDEKETNLGNAFELKVFTSMNLKDKFTLFRGQVGWMKDDFTMQISKCFNNS